MAKYSVTNGASASGGTQQATGSAYVGAILGLTGSTTSPRRFKVYDLLIGTNGTPSDNAMEWDISRVTTASTATTVTAAPLDMADAAAINYSVVNSSTHGTITVGSNLFYVGVNTRASYRWVAAPGGELVGPATSSAGVQLRQRSPTGYTGTATGTWHFEEQ